MRKLLVVLLALAPLLAQAQSWPTKPVRIVLPFGPGGVADITTRTIAPKLSEAFGQQVVVENMPGAGGIRASETVARAEPDGHTLIIVSATYAATSAYRPPPFDPINDITPIAHVGTTGLLFTVHPSVPAKTMAELIAHARAHPGKLNFGTVGAGSNVHLALELFKLMTKTDFVAVPYKGGGPAMTAIVGGEIQVAAMSMVPSMPHVKSGRVRALAVTTAGRSPYLPDVPAVSETVPGYEASHWYGMWGPKGLPKPVVARWNAAVNKLLQTEEAQTRLQAEGLEAGGGPPEVFGKINREAIEKWRRVIREAGIKAKG